MFKTLKGKVKTSNKLPERVNQLEIMNRILDGSLYDVQDFEFHQERNDRGEPILIEQRAPSVDIGLGLMRNVVNHTVSFTFGEGRFPELAVDDNTVRDVLTDVIMECNLAEIMQDAMFRGSVGSVAVHFSVSKNNRVHFKVCSSQYLTPTWDQDEPDVLIGIKEKFIVLGKDLSAMGYTVDPATNFQQYFFQREWTDQEEIWYYPQLVIQNGDEQPPIVDPTRSILHALGFCPWKWMKNLRGGDEIDGLATFYAGIKQCIEIDYLVSQGDRGLRYQADPTLVIVNPVAPDQSIFRSAANALVLDAQGSAHLLEMKGTAHGALLEQVRALRDGALEAMGGNRSMPDKMTSVQSGYALEVLWMPVIMLTGDLRHSYGQNGLLALLRMVLKVGAQRQLRVNQKLVPILREDVKCDLIWPRYFEPTEQDRLTQSQTLIPLVQSGLMSKKTAVQQLANTYDLPDIDGELAAIEQDMADMMKDRVDEAGATAEAENVTPPVTPKTTSGAMA